MSRGAIALWVAATVIACGGGDPTFAPRFAVPGGADTAIPIADLPWPNDTHRGADGRYRVEPGTVPLTEQADERVVRGIAAALSERGCVGITSAAVFPLDAADPSDPLVVESADVAFLDLTDGSELEVEVHVRALEGQVSVRPVPGVVLAPGHTYGVTLAAGLATAGGVPLEIRDDLTCVLGPGCSDARLARANTAYAPLREHLAARAIDPASIAGATVFTTCEYAPTFEAIGDAIAADEPPAVIVDRVFDAGPELDALLGTPADNRRPGVDNPGGIAHADIAHVILGAFEAPNYQSEVPGQLGRWQFDAAGVPQRRGYDAVPFLLALPAGVASYADLPVIVFQHGLSNSRTQVLEVANLLCARGFAVIGIDIPFHGERFPEAVDTSSNFTGDRSPDGIADPTGPTASMYLFNIQSGDDWLDPRVIQASFAQAIIELMALGRLLADGAWNPVRDATGSDELSFDRDHIVFAGESFGAIIGLSAVAYQPAFGAAFLSAAGGGLLNTLLESSPTYGGLFLPILGGALAIAPGEIDPVYDPPHTHLGFQLLGPLLDWGDPVAHGRGLVAAGRHVAIISAHADESVPNQASQLLAASVGLSWVDTNASTDGPRYVALPRLEAPVAGNAGGVTAAFLEIAPATHGMMTRSAGEQRFLPDFPPITPLPETIAVTNPIVELQNMLADFADSYIADGVPSLIDRF